MIKLTKRLSYLLLTLIGLITYFNTFANSFVWDDEILIIGNDYIKSFSNLFKIFSVDSFHWTTGSNFYRPLFSLSLMLDYHLWKLNSLGFHLTNFILHLINTFLIFYLINFLVSNLRVSLIGGLFYLLHPVHTQAVTYISGRADLLAVFFVLGTVLFFAKNLYFASIISFICGLLSKEIVLFLPLSLILYDYCFGNISKNLKRHTIFFFIVLIYLILRTKFLPFNPHGMLPQSFFIRLINLPKVIIFYLSLLVIPWNLRIERPFPLSESFDLSVLFSILLLLVIFSWIFKHRGKKILLFSSLWFFFNLFPITNIILPLNAIVAEHWLYLPSIGFFIILAMGIDKLLLKDSFILAQKLSYRFKMTILIAIISALGLLTISRNFEWRNPVILFESALKLSKDEASPKDTRVHFNLGTSYLNNGRYDQAIAEFNKALKGIPFPRCKETHYRLAIAYLAKSSHKEAKKELLKAIEAEPNDIPAYYLLGYLYKKEGDGDIEKAKEAWQKIIKIKPLNPKDEVLIKKAKELLDSQ